MQQITIIMYHYVRALEYTRYPNIKGLETKKFKQQITYLRENYSIVSAKECIKCIHNPSVKLPPNPALLTFDDGYIDHFTTVFPILNKHNISGCFFVPAKTIKHHRVLDVNKIHFILASAKDPQQIKEDIFKLLLANKDEYVLQDPHYYYTKFAKSSRYDSKDIIFIKRLLQKGLKPSLREKITHYLFDKYVSTNEKAFSRELYMSMDQIRCMAKNGMYIGGHGYDHLWLDQLSDVRQEEEIDKTIAFLEELGISTKEWVMCYPYGAYDDRLIKLLKKKNCALGLTTKVGTANLNHQHAYTLKRFDTNDLQNLIEGKPNVILRT